MFLEIFVLVSCWGTQNQQKELKLCMFSFQNETRRVCCRSGCDAVIEDTEDELQHCRGVDLAGRGCNTNAGIEIVLTPADTHRRSTRTVTADNEDVAAARARARARSARFDCRNGCVTLPSVTRTGVSRYERPPSSRRTLHPGSNGIMLGTEMLLRNNRGGAVLTESGKTAGARDSPVSASLGEAVCLGLGQFERQRSASPHITRVTDNTGLCQDPNSTCTSSLPGSVNSHIEDSAVEQKGKTQEGWSERRQVSELL